ncbi:MAG TPA: patatin [Bacteroidetes bacterium]|jgi:NTE family protein|nr:patatin [Bacteroidota bacterium]
MDSKTGLVLSGGGARGIAHIGVLQALDDAGIEIDMISGCSAGAIVGALHAAGVTPEKILGFIEHKSLYGIVKMGLPKKGMMELSYFREVLHKEIKSDRFDSLKKPLYVAVTNLNKGGCEIKSKGDHLIDYIIASASVPMVFHPVEIEGHLYVDGGVINNLPTEPLRDKCSTLIGVNVNTVDYVAHISGITDVGLRCMDISFKEHVQARLQICDMAIEPAVSKFGIFTLNKAREIYQAGLEAAQRAIAAYQEKSAHGTSASG